MTTGFIYTKDNEIIQVTLDSIISCAGKVESILVRELCPPKRLFNLAGGIENIFKSKTSASNALVIERLREVIQMKKDFAIKEATLLELMAESQRIFVEEMGL